MYWNVPTSAPSTVSGCAMVGDCVWMGAVASCPRAAIAGPMARASPKSMSLAPDFDSITFPGLRSR
jgi:hypothetical protein